MTIESRPSLPYVSHIKIVKYPSLSWVGAGKNEQGQDMMRRQGNQPSIQVEITNYIGNEKAFATPYTFASKAFLQSNLAQLVSIEKPSVEIAGYISAIQSRLATEKLWLEDVLLAAGIPELEGLWSDAFSNALDTFPQWSESQTPIRGIPVYMRQLEWDARLPLDSNKAVTVTMGLYPTAACDSQEPVRKTLQFEDGATTRARQSQIAQLESLIADRTLAISIIDAIAVLKASPLSAERTARLASYSQSIVEQADLAAYKTQVQQELAGYTQQLAEMRSVTYGTILSLLSSPSVATSIHSLIIAVIGTLKTNVAEWSALDMDLVAARFFVPDVS